jgi:hypothetical protein
MSATPDQLPNDIEEMKRLFLAQATNLEKLNAELTAAKAGLMAFALEIEKLKFQLARLRRQRFGSSSERIDREVPEFRGEAFRSAGKLLKLEDLEATKAEAEVKATSSPTLRRVPSQPGVGHACGSWSTVSCATDARRTCGAASCFLAAPVRLRSYPLHLVWLGPRPLKIEQVFWRMLGSLSMRVTKFQAHGREISVSQLVGSHSQRQWRST